MEGGGRIREEDGGGEREEGKRERKRGREGDASSFHC